MIVFGKTNNFKQSCRLIDRLSTMSAPPTKRILGIDPGTNVLGFAIIDADTKHIQVIEIGVLTFAHIGEAHTDKLRYIFEQVQDIIQQYSPVEMAI